MKSYFLIGALLLLLSACKRDDEVYSTGNANSVALSSIISITNISAGTVQADTAATSQISFHINPETAAANRTIALKTTLGNFLNGNKTMTLTADAAGNAIAIIRSPLPGDALVTATVKSISIDTVIRFKAAPADDLLLTADKYNTDTSQSIILTALLSRNPGRGLPTDPAKVFFTVTPGTGSGALVYPAFASTTNHSASVTITNPFKITGTFKVEAKTVGDNVDTVRKTLTLVIK